MLRFKELTTAPPQSADAADDNTDTRSAARERVESERPDPRDAVADRGGEREAEGRVATVADSPRRSTFKSYREGYATLRDRVLNRETTDSRDPFLESGAAASERVPGDRCARTGRPSADEWTRRLRRPCRSAAAAYRVHRFRLAGATWVE